MILLWFKIIYYKIIKIFRPDGAEAGTEPHVRARVTRAVDGYGIAPKAETTSRETVDRIVGFTREPGAPDHTIRTERLRRLIELGLVSEPDGQGDLIRVEQWREDWARREAGDPSACPCGGRHYPEPDACRWCRCHDPRNKHHAAPSVGIMQVIKPELTGRMLFDRDPVTESAVRPPAEIVCCPRCDHPQHAMGNGRCAFLVPYAALGDIDVPTVCGCTVTPDEEQA